MLSSLSEVEKNKLDNGTLTDEEIKKVTLAVEKLSDIKLYIDDTPAITIEEIKEKCIRLKQERNIDLVVIDYFQLIDTDKFIEDAKQQTTYISNELKKLTEELNIPIIVTSQLPRELELREDKRPVLKDLKYSGSLIKDADIIMFLYRDYYYNVNTKYMDEAELLIAKNKYSCTSTIKLKSLLKYSRFDNIELKEQ